MQNSEKGTSDKTLIESYIPHRSTMLLLDRMISVSGQQSSAEINITLESSFFIPGKGVPSWIGLEYMGQTAALIAGYQLNEGLVTPHLGLLLGTRKYQVSTPWFVEGSRLVVECKELAVVGEGLATFQCSICCAKKESTLANGNLTVFRRPLTEDVKDIGETR